MSQTQHKGGGAVDPKNETSTPKTFFQSTTAVISFLIGTLLFNMVFGKKVTRMMLILVLMSILLLNARKITNVMQAIRGDYS